MQENDALPMEITLSNVKYALLRIHVKRRCRCGILVSECRQLRKIALHKVGADGVLPNDLTIEITARLDGTFEGLKIHVAQPKPRFEARPLVVIEQ